MSGCVKCLKQVKVVIIHGSRTVSKTWLYNEKLTRLIPTIFLERFFKSLKVEWVYKYKYNHRSQAELSIFQWIETWYNRRKIHSTLGKETILEFEQEMNNYNVAA